MSTTLPTRDDVFRLFGAISDHGVVDILAARPSIAQLEEVSMWLAQEDDVMGEARVPLTGLLADVLDVLMRDEEYAEAEPEEL